MTGRVPNTHSPVEVRRAIARLRLDTADLDPRVTANESDIASIDGRVDILEGRSPSYSGEADEGISAGQPVYGLSGLTAVGVARADTAAKSKVAGVAVADTGAGFSCSYLADGRLELSDWTSATGSASLVPSAVYYLSLTGGLTTTAPTTTGELVVRVGKARGTTVLDIEISPPVLL